MALRAQVLEPPYYCKALTVIPAHLYNQMRSSVALRDLSKLICLQNRLHPSPLGGGMVI